MRRGAGIGTNLLGALLLTLALVAQAAEPSWGELTPAERLALHPLQSHWNGIDSARKQKWREIAARLPSLPRDQQIRMQARMAEWAGMTPAQRNAARLHFETNRQVPLSERQALWQAYQSLPEAQRRALAQQAAARRSPAVTAAAASGPTGKAAATSQPRALTAPAASARKAMEARPKAIGPATVQASVGASTRVINQPPTPPRHQQAGMPKIVASTGFVHGATLLPQRGPQGAAVEPVTAR
ncbi:MAG: DUF3106 domain-containing protein [Burkholderiaceae bacterium]|nr:DUF3106 domain-containing protein [Burkholderiaceae bacterium]